MYSTYVGPFNPYGIAVDQAGAAYLAGTTYTDGLATTLQRIRMGSNDAFVMKLNAAGSTLVWATYLGGTYMDEAGAIAVGPGDEAYVTGSTHSTDFPVTPWAYQRSNKSPGKEEVFVSRISADGRNLIYSTFLGGSGQEGAFRIVVDNTCAAVVSGITNSTDFPVTSGTAAFPSGPGFVTKIATEADGGLVFSFRGPLWSDLAVHGDGTVYLAGAAASAEFPMNIDSLQDTLRGSSDGVLVQLSPAGDKILFSTYLGGRSADTITAVDLDEGGDVYVAGQVRSADFPVTPGSHQFRLSGASDGFITKIGRYISPEVATVSAASYGRGLPVAPGSIASAFGPSLAQFTEAAAEIPLPTSLGGVSVSVRDAMEQERLAPLFFASTGQINYLVPEGTALGPATVTVLAGGVAGTGGWVLIDAVTPALFTANSDGRGAAVGEAVKLAADGTLTSQWTMRCPAGPGTCSCEPIDLGPEGDQVVVVLYGTGIRGRSDVSKVTVQIGGTDAAVEYAGAQSQYVGLDQLNVRIPRALAGRGEVDLVLTVEERVANPVRLAFR